MVYFGLLDPCNECGQNILRIYYIVELPDWFEGRKTL